MTDDQLKENYLELIWNLCWVVEEYEGQVNEQLEEWGAEIARRGIADAEFKDRQFEAIGMFLSDFWRLTERDHRKEGDHVRGDEAGFQHLGVEMDWAELGFKV